jgi:hypothetical protein
MAYVTSWIWSFVAGGFSVAFILIALGAIAATVMAIIGVFRRRCPKCAIFMHLVVIPICALLYMVVFWVSDYLIQPDTISTAIFWGSAAVACIRALSKEAPQLMKEVWQVTNSPFLTVAG